MDLLTVHIMQVILFSVVCLVGLVGNTLVIYVVLRYSKMQTVTNMYIVNLAIADECFLIGIPFLIATIINQSWIFGHIACKAYMITTSINQFTSSILLCVMSADRYIAVCHPISSPRWRTPMISKMVSVLAWLWSILLIIPIIKYAREIPNERGNKSCIIDWTSYSEEYLNSTNSSNLTLSSNETAADLAEDKVPVASFYTIYTFTFSFAIPLCLILIFYYQVIKKLKTVGPKNKSKEKKRSHRKVTNLVLTVITVYVICWLPYWVSQLALEYGNSHNETFEITMHLLASCLSYSNSAINPILYAFLSDNFKKSFLKACTCAANKEVNATLHLENSVFPRKARQSSERYRNTRGTSICPNNEDEGEGGLLVVSKGDASSSGTMMTSRTTTTSLNNSRDGLAKNNVLRNGSLTPQPHHQQPTSL